MSLGRGFFHALNLTKNLFSIEGIYRDLWKRDTVWCPGAYWYRLLNLWVTECISNISNDSRACWYTVKQTKTLDHPMVNGAVRNWKFVWIEAWPTTLRRRKTRQDYKKVSKEKISKSFKACLKHFRSILVERGDHSPRIWPHLALVWFCLVPHQSKKDIILIFLRKEREIIRQHGELFIENIEPTRTKEID